MKSPLAGIGQPQLSAKIQNNFVPFDADDCSSTAHGFLSVHVEHAARWNDVTAIAVHIDASGNVRRHRLKAGREVNPLVRQCSGRCRGDAERCRWRNCHLAREVRSKDCRVIGNGSRTWRGDLTERSDDASRARARDCLHPKSLDDVTDGIASGVLQGEFGPRCRNRDEQAERAGGWNLSTEAAPDPNDFGSLWQGRHACSSLAASRRLRCKRSVSMLAPGRLALWSRWFPFINPH
jgi:hypothetical protein